MLAFRALSGVCLIQDRLYLRLVKLFKAWAGERFIIGRDLLFIPQHIQPSAVLVADVMKAAQEAEALLLMEADTAQVAAGDAAIAGGDFLRLQRGDEGGVEQTPKTP